MTRRPLARNGRPARNESHRTEAAGDGDPREMVTAARERSTESGLQASSALPGERRAMTAKTWQMLALVTIAAVAVVLVTDCFFVSRDGSLGMTIARIPGTTHPVRYRVTHVDAAGGAAHLVQPDDVVALAGDSALERARLRTLPPGGTLAFRVTRDGRSFVTAIPIRQTSSPTDLALTITYLVLAAAFASVAALIALRRPGEPAARALVNFFIMFAAAIACSPLSAVAPPAIIVAIAVVSSLFFTLGTLEAARFTTLFPSPATAGVRAYVRRAYPFLFAFAVVTVGAAHAQEILVGGETTRLNAIALGVWWAVVAAGLVVSLVASNREAAGADLVRIRWASISIAAGLSGMLCLIVAELLGHLETWTQLLPLTLLAVPVGVTYAMLRHRLLDIEFAINRALVFAGVSTVVVVAFGILEWLIGRVLVAWGHVTSASLELALALALGYSLRAIHKRTERVVDDVFFRERHEHEAALRRFAAESAYITERRTLVERTLAACLTHGGTDTAALYIVAADGSIAAAVPAPGFPAALDRNDPLVVRLRAFREPVHLRDTSTALAGDIALPLLVRGDFTGALVCGPKREGEPYAPDEIAVLTEVARAVASALDVLDVADLRSELERLRARDLPAAPSFS